MGNNILSDLYKKTNGGLEIITDLFTAVDDDVINKKKAFRLRTDERTPSAHLYPPDLKRPYWHVKDYGMGEGGGLFSPIDLYMWDRDYGQDKFRMAVEELAERYGVQEVLSKSSNKPDIEQRAALPDEIGAMPRITLSDGLGGFDLSCWGSNVKAEHLETYGWKGVSEVAITYGDKVIVRKPTPTYPIFAQQCDYVDEQGQQQTFYKIYEPKNPDKAHRFLIVGKKPQQNYIYGLQAVRQRFQEQGEEKLSVLLLVSGGSDAIAALSHGYLAVWLDSETKGLSDFEYNLLMKYTNWLVNIPDIDMTGVKVGRQLALTHLGIHTAWLSQNDMGGLHDNRGRQCKDLRDYCRLNPSKKAMDTLVNRAIKAKFWCEHKNKQGQKDYTLSLTSLNYFLELNGFYTLKDETRKEPVYIRIDGIIVQRITAKTIVSFLKNWMEQQGLAKALQDKVLRSRDLPTNNVSTLRERDDLDFTRATATSQRFYFRNCWVEVTAEGIVRHSYSEPSNHYVWKEDIIDHNYCDMPKMFNVVTNDDGTYLVEINDDIELSKYMQIVVKTSRLHWRKEDEYGLPLTDDEKAEENLCLVSKLANIGYLQHSYKSESEAYATLCLDYAMTESTDECNGRSGKSFYIDAMLKTKRHFKIDAGVTSFRDSRFLFDGVTEDTDIVFIDECPSKFNYNFIYGMVTGDFRVEGKNQHSFVIPFTKSPKFTLATNYVLPRHDPSTEGRIWQQVFSDYFHVQTNKNDYKETRSIRDEFGQNIMGAEYSEQDWQLDIAFMLQCMQFYMSLTPGNRRILPPMNNIERREQLMSLGKDFKQWADDYFSEGSGNVDTMIKVDTVLADFNNETKFAWAPRTLKKHLMEYCKMADHLHCLNPACITMKEKDGEQWRVRDENSNPKYYYYVQTEKEFLANQAPKEPELQF